MKNLTKNKVLTWLVLLLLLANATSIAMFWFYKGKANEHPKQTHQPNGKPQDFLIKELNFDAAQQVQLEAFSKEHREAINSFGGKIKEVKENFFSILKQQNTTDSTKKNAAAAISNITQQIDLLTLNHFEKVRAICTPDQQKKFDEIIKQVIGMMSEQRRTGAPREPLNIGEEGNRPPPKDDKQGEEPPL